jgi:hypothetical protein
LTARDFPLSSVSENYSSQLPLNNKTKSYIAASLEQVDQQLQQTATEEKQFQKPKFVERGTAVDGHEFALRSFPAIKTLARGPFTHFISGFQYG